MPQADEAVSILTLLIGMILQEHVAHMLKDSVPPRPPKRNDTEAVLDENGEDEAAAGGIGEANEDIESEDEDDDDEAASGRKTEQQNFDSNSDGSDGS